MYPLQLWKVLTQDDAASTFKRLFTSRHVVDLQLIFWSSCVLIILGSAFAFTWHWLAKDAGGIADSTLISAIVGTGCGVLAWCYLTGSTRLGVVDLFACEITTICKVIAISETADHFVALFADPPEDSIKFNSEEEYSPVFNNNSKDLESLEARVLAPVTEFYTYQKTVRDYLRRLSNIDKPKNNVAQWQITVANVLYMLFLMLESARKSVNALVEFEPEQAESEITILLAELVAYSFLIRYYENASNKGCDARLERLRLRKLEYPEIVQAVCDRTERNKGQPGRNNKAWRRAAALLDELKQKYFNAIGEPMTSVPLVSVPTSQKGLVGDVISLTASAVYIGDSGFRAKSVVQPYSRSA